MIKMPDQAYDIIQSRLDLGIFFAYRLDPSSGFLRPLSFSWKVNYHISPAPSREIFAQPLSSTYMSGTLEMKFLEVYVSPYSRNAVPWITLCPAHISCDLTPCSFLILRGNHYMCLEAVSLSHSSPWHSGASVSWQLAYVMTWKFK